MKHLYFSTNITHYYYHDIIIKMDLMNVLMVKSHAKYNATLFCAMPKHIENR